MIVFVRDKPYRVAINFWHREVYLQELNLEEGKMYAHVSVPFIMFGGDKEVGEHGELDMNIFNKNLDAAFPNGLQR